MDLSGQFSNPSRPLKALLDAAWRPATLARKAVERDERLAATALDDERNA